MRVSTPSKLDSMSLFQNRMTVKPCVTSHASRAVINAMLPAINLDDYASLQTYEIDDIRRPDRNLTTELDPAEPPVAQREP